MIEEKQTEEKQDVYQRVTDRIVAAIEGGNVGSWSRPWHTTGGAAFSPINVGSRKAYRGINTLCLWAAAQAKGYGSGTWGTYKQWQDRGAQVRKGEKASEVVFWKFANGGAAAEGEDTVPASAGRSRLLFTRGYSVFNAAQVEGYAPAVEKPATLNDRIAHADSFFAKVGAAVQHGGNSAHYSPATDHIQMPPFQAFKDSVGYYSVLAHETTHWTSRGDRCDRQLGKRFGDAAYAAEELIAELGAAFCCAHLELASEPREDHAKYVANWLGVLKADKRAIFVAASRAQAAVDFMIRRAGEAVADDASLAEAA